MTATAVEAPAPVAVARFYGDEPLRDPKGFLRMARSRLRRVDFDTVVATGLSGIPAATLLGNSMRKHILIVRKPDDTSNHHGGKSVGELGQRWIFVDDFISSGATRRRVAEEVVRLAEWNREFLYRNSEVQPVYVGSYLFKDEEWVPSPDGSVPQGRYL